MNENTEKNLNKIVQAIEKNNDLVYKFVNKTHDSPSPETRQTLEEHSKELNEIKIKLSKFDVVEEKIDRISEKIDNISKSTREKEESYVTKDSLKAELSTFKVYFSILGILGMTALNFLVDYIKK